LWPGQTSINDFPGTFSGKILIDSIIELARNQNFVNGWRGGGFEFTFPRGCEAAFIIGLNPV